MKIGLGSLQGVIFTNSFDLSNSLIIAQSFNSLKAIKFDGNPTILPLPAEAPLELPRIILRTSDNQFSLNISPIRVDIFYNNNKLDKEGVLVGELKDVEELVVAVMNEITELIINKFSAKIPRLALVINNVITLEDSSKKYLADYFIKSEPLQDSSEMQLNFLMKKEVNKYKYNEWLRFNTLRKQQNLEDDKALLFIVDFNSIVEVDYNFNKTSVDELIKAFISLSKTEIQKYIQKSGKDG